MKKRIVMMMLCVMLAASGCNAPETVAGIASAAGLTAVARVLNDVEAITDREKALLLADRVVMEEKLAAATTETEKAKLTASIERSETLEKGLETANKVAAEAKVVAVETGKLYEKAKEVDFKEPEDVVAYVALVLTAIGAYFTDKKRRHLDSAVKSYAAESTPTEAGKLMAKVNGK